MASRKLTITIDCPEWCESPARHLDDGSIYHKHTIGKIKAAGWAAEAGDPDLVQNVEVTLERYDTLEEDQLRHGAVCVRLGGDEVYAATAAQELVRMLQDVAKVLDSQP